MHGPLGPEVSAIHPPRECRGQPPTWPAGLAQWDLKVRPRCSPRVLGWRGLRGVHGGGQRGLRSEAGRWPEAHRRPVVGPLWVARKSFERPGTRRLGRERRRATEDKGGRKRKKKSFRKSPRPSGSRAADLVAKNKIGSSPFSTKSKTPCSDSRRLQAPVIWLRKVTGGALCPRPDSTTAAAGSSRNWGRPLGQPHPDSINTNLLSVLFPSVTCFEVLNCETFS